MVIRREKIWVPSVIVFLVALIFISAVGFLPRVFPGTFSQSGILYAFMGETFFADVYVFYPNKRLKKLSPSHNGIYYQPHINPQGDKVVFFGNDAGSPRIWLAHLDTGDVVALTPTGSSARHPVFSWDGTMIAFASDRAFQQARERIELMRGNGLPPESMHLNLFVMDTDGRHVRQITYGPFQDQRPAFSPDGKTIVFVSNRDGERRLWSVAIDGNQVPRPLQTEGWGYRPWYSADGQWLYFFTDVNGRDQICKQSINGGPIIPLANDDSGTSHGPFVDYTDEVLLFHSTRGGKFGLWELPLDGGEPRQIPLPHLEGEPSHATRSQNGILAFDVYQQTVSRKIASFIKDITK